MAVIESLLMPPTSALFVLLIAVGMVLLSMIVNRRLIDVSRLQSVNREMRKYNEELKRSKERGDNAALRRLRREERRLKQLNSYSQKQRLRATFITIIPFSVVSLILGFLFGGSSVARLPFETPLGNHISFYLWYTLCYFAVYFPLTRVFGLGLGLDMPRSVSGRAGGR